jgi:hypothetical protein
MSVFTERTWRQRFARCGLMGSALTVLAGGPVQATNARPVQVAVLPLKLLDTSGEPADQSAQHTVRLARLSKDLAIDLSGTGLYHAEAISAESLEQECPSNQAACLLESARSRGAQLIFIGVVHKSSTLILQFWARLVDARTGRDILIRDLNFRGDTDEAWHRAEAFLVAQIRDAATTAP